MNNVLLIYLISFLYNKTVLAIDILVAARVEKKDKHPLYQLMDKDQRTFGQLQKKCTDLNLKPCRGLGIDREALLKKVWDAEQSQQNTERKVSETKNAPTKSVKRVIKQKLPRKKATKRQQSIKKVSKIKKVAKSPQQPNTTKEAAKQKHSIKKVSKDEEVVKSPKGAKKFIKNKELVNSPQAPKKKVSVARQKKVPLSSLSAEEIVQRRDPLYYKEIKDIVPAMPDIRIFESEIAIRSAGEWDNKKRWSALLQDLETLDEAKQRGDDQDLDLIALINLSHEPPPDTERKRENLRKKIRSLRASFITRKNAREFVLNYPALTWLFSVTEPIMHQIAILGGYDEWIDYSQPTDIEKIELLYSARHYPEIIDNILNSISFDNPVNYAMLKSQYNDWLSCETCKNLVLALINEKFPISHNKLLYVIKNYPFDLFIEIFEANNYDIDEGVIDASAEAEDINIFKYFIKKGVDYTKQSGDIYDNAIEQNRIDVVKLLVENGAPLFVSSVHRKDKIHVLEKAIYHDRLEILDYLLSLPGYNGDKYILKPRTHGDETLIEYSMYKPRILKYLLNRFKGQIDKTTQVSLLYSAATHRNESTEIIAREFEYSEEELDNANIIAYTHANSYGTKFLESIGANRPVDANSLFKTPM